MTRAWPTTAQRGYQREFASWLQSNRKRFGLPPERVRRTLRYVRLHFAQLNPVLDIRVREYSISVLVVWRGELFDMVFDEDVVPRRNGNAYVCGLCAVGPDPDPPRRFADVTSLRAKHQFESLLNWCNDTLFPARYVELCGHAGFQRRVSARAARLLRDLPEGAVCKRSPESGRRYLYLPVWLDQGVLAASAPQAR